jgi:sugar phosphate isomerase/epimerase
MKLSSIPVSFFDSIRGGQMSVTEWMDFAAGLGLDGVECGPPLIRPIGPATPAEYRRLAAERGLAVSNYTAYSDFTHPDPEVRKREIAAALNNVAVAKELGAPSVRALTGQQWPGVEQAQGVAWVVEGIRRMAEQADRAGLRVNVENHTKASTWANFDFAIRGEVFLRVLEALRDAPVGVQFDTANPLVAGEDALALFEKVRSRIGYVHVNDVRRPGVFEFVTVGTGIAPIREVLDRLHKQGYAGWVGIEEASRTGRDGFRQAVRYVRQALSEIERQP